MRNLLALLAISVLWGCSTVPHGIQEHSPPATYEGISFFNERDTQDIRLIHPDGSTYHVWTVDGISSRFNYPLILSGGSLVYLDFSGIIGMLDSSSEKLWEHNLGAHHDADLAEPGVLLTFNRAVREFPERDIFLTDELLTFLDITDGSILRQFSLYETLDRTLDLYELNSLVWDQHHVDPDPFYLDDDSYSMFHANSIFVLRSDYGGEFQSGRALITIRNLNLIVLIDLAEEEVLWHWGSDMLDHPHYAVMTPQGNLMVYDNGLLQRDFSRVIELDPHTKTVMWTYNQDGDQQFYSRVMGSAQPLPNGNILITESVESRAFEITRDGSRVWSYQGTGRIFRFEKYDQDCIDAVFSGAIPSNRDYNLK